VTALLQQFSNRTGEVAVFFVGDLRVRVNVDVLWESELRVMFDTESYDCDGGNPNDNAICTFSGKE
jgi:hypothetical protein